MKAAAAAPAPSKADRAAYFAKGAGTAGDLRDSNDLVGNVANGTMTVEAAPASALPDDLRGLDKDALKQEITKRVEQRQAAQKELKALAGKRDEFLRAKAGAKRADSFDNKVNDTLDAQLK
jgi:hypothetical protein